MKGKKFGGRSKQYLDAKARARKAFRDARRFGNSNPGYPAVPLAVELAIAGALCVESVQRSEAERKALELDGPCVERKLSVSEVQRMMEVGIPMSLLPTGLVRIPLKYISTGLGRRVRSA